MVEDDHGGIRCADQKHDVVHATACRVAVVGFFQQLHRRVALLKSDHIPDVHFLILLVLQLLALVDSTAFQHAAARLIHGYSSLYYFVFISRSMSHQKQQTNTWGRSETEELYDPRLKGNASENIRLFVTLRKDLDSNLEYKKLTVMAPGMRCCVDSK